MFVLIFWLQELVIHSRRPLPVSHQLELEPEQHELHLSELLLFGLVNIELHVVQVTSSPVLSVVYVIICDQEKDIYRRRIYHVSAVCQPELLLSGLLYIALVQVTSSPVLWMFCVIFYDTGERYVQTVLFCTC